MTRSLKALIEKSIDYAGLFPPANLSMEKAVVNYNEYRDGTDSWMLSHFICPATKLAEFEEVCGRLMDKREPYRLSALSRKAEEQSRFLEYFQQDAEVIKQFAESIAGKVVVDIFEVSLPQGIASQAENFKKGLYSASETKSPHEITPCKVRVYYEVSLSSSWQEEMKSVIRTIAKHNSSSITQSTSDKTSMAGFKLRCGGVIKAEQFPSVEQVVCCVKSCLNEGVPLKLTAGLHHPFRHFNESAKTKMHGFINIFSAVLLGKTYKLDEGALSKIIEDEDHTNFRFEEQSFSWKDINITIDQIKNGRNNDITSFGCCSFDEPRKDLRNFGLL